MIFPFARFFAKQTWHLCGDFVPLHAGCKEKQSVKVVNMSETPSVVNQYVSELRDAAVQQDRMRFRRNLERIGELQAYEISKGLCYGETAVQTPLAECKCQCLAECIVLATIFRAGLPLHQGFLGVFDKAENAFVSAYRYYKDKECEQVGIKIEYIASPDLTGKTLIIADPMLATGGSMELAYQALNTKGTPSHLHLCSVIASQKGVDYIKNSFSSMSDVTLWCAAVDPELNEHAYIVPGLGDAGDLAYGEKV